MAMDRDDIIDLLSIIAVNDDRSIGDTDIALWIQMIGLHAKDDALDAIQAHFLEYPDTRITPGHVNQRVKAMVRDRLERMEPDERAALAGPPEVRRDRYGYIDKSAPDPEPYPEDWTPAQRVSAYWAQLRNKHLAAPPRTETLPFFDPFCLPPCPDCGSTRSCLCHEMDRPAQVHPNDELPPASPEHIRRVRAWYVQHQAAKCGAPIPPVETAGLSPLSVACPHCKAPEGQRCVNPRLGDANEPFKGGVHPSRLEAVGIPDAAQAGARQVLVDRARAAAPAVAFPVTDSPTSPTAQGLDAAALIERGKAIAAAGTYTPTEPPAPSQQQEPPELGRRDEHGQLHFPDTDALDAEWAARHERVFGSQA